MVAWANHTPAGQETERIHFVTCGKYVYLCNTLKAMPPCRCDQTLHALTCLEIKNVYFICHNLAPLAHSSVDYEHVVELHHTGEGYFQWNRGVRFRHDFPALQRGQVDLEDLVEIDIVTTGPSFASESVSRLVDFSDGHALKLIREAAVE